VARNPEYDLRAAGRRVVTAIDTYILVYAHRADSPFHAQAKSAIDQLVGSGMPWGVAWRCAHEFLAIVTHPKIYAPPFNGSRRGPAIMKYSNRC
jgi:predicted nucleic acid-binding protein